MSDLLGRTDTDTIVGLARPLAFAVAQDANQAIHRSRGSRATYQWNTNPRDSVIAAVRRTKL